MKPWLEAFCGIVYPEQCLVCGGLLGRGAHHFCAACREGLPWIGEHVCPRCGAPVGIHGSTAQGCAACRCRRLAFRRAVAPLRYQGVVRELILAFKLGRRASLSYALGDLLCGYLGECGVSRAADLVVPVPLHWRRQVSRGFNQAALIAIEVARSFRIPLAPRLLARRRATVSQTALSGLGRGANVRGAFAVRRAVGALGRLLRRGAGPPSLLGKRVLLIDDVYTTGATVHECARVLREAGAAEVLVATIAHTCR